jgi:hypothetical protein
LSATSKRSRRRPHGPIHPKLAKKTVLFSITYIHKAGGEVRVKGWQKSVGPLE